MSASHSWLQVYRYTYHSLDIHAQMQTFMYIHKHSQMLNSMIEAHSYRVDNWQIYLEHICSRINNK